MSEDNEDLMSLLANPWAIDDIAKIDHIDTELYWERIGKGDQSASRQMLRYHEILDAEQGDAAASYNVLDVANSAIRRVLLIDKALGKSSMSNDDLGAVKFLLRRLEDVATGIPPDEAFKLKPRRGGGGRLTAAKQSEKRFVAFMERHCASLVHDLMENGVTLEDACVRVSEALGSQDKTASIRGWYSAHLKELKACTVKDGNDLETRLFNLEGYLERMKNMFHRAKIEALPPATHDAILIHSSHKKKPDK